MNDIDCLCPNKLKAPEIPKLSRSGSFLIFFVFFGLGCSCLLLWNCLLNVLPAVLKILYPDLGSFTDTVTATYFSVVCALSLVLTLYPITKTYVIEVLICGLIILCIMFILIVLYSTEQTVSLLFHLYAGTVGIGAACVLNGGYSIAATIPHPCIASISTGMGFSGLFTAGIWLLFQYGIFQEKTVENAHLSIIILMSAAAVINCITLILFAKFINWKWLSILFQDEIHTTSLFKVRDFNDLRATYAGNALQEYKRIGYCGVFRKTYKSLIVRCFIFFQTLLVFPTIGPLSWHTVLLMEDILIMIFQVGDFAGRYATYIAPRVNIPETQLLIALAIRTVLVFTFIFSMTHYTSVFWGSSIFHCFQMTIFALTDGWLSTVAAIHLPTHVEGSVAKTVASAFGLTTSFWGVASGQWFSKLIKTLLYAE